MRSSGPRLRMRRLVAAAMLAGTAAAQSGLVLTFVPGIPQPGTGYKTHVVAFVGVPAKGTGYKTH